MTCGGILRTKKLKTPLLKILSNQRLFLRGCAWSCFVCCLEFKVMSLTPALGHASFAVWSSRLSLWGLDLVMLRLLSWVQGYLSDTCAWSCLVSCLEFNFMPLTPALGHASSAVWSSGLSLEHLRLVMLRLLFRIQGYLFETWTWLCFVCCLEFKVISLRPGLGHVSSTVWNSRLSLWDLDLVMLLLLFEVQGYHFGVLTWSCFVCCMEFKVIPLTPAVGYVSSAVWSSRLFLWGLNLVMLHLLFGVSPFRFLPT